MFGRGRDLALFDQLRGDFSPPGNWLKSVGLDRRDGLILGKPPQPNRNASHLRGLEFLETKDVRPFQIPAKLTRLAERQAQWPRARQTYEEPILLIKEFLKAGPRPVTAVAERDLVYTDAYFGASLPREQLKSARLISAILCSALASWFFLMTAAEFGVWKRRLLTSDLTAATA